MPRIQGALISCGGGRLSRSTRSGKSNPLPVPAPIPPIPPTLTGRSRCIGRGALPRYMGGGGGRSRSKRDRSRSWRCQSLANSRGLSGSPLRCIKCKKDKERRNWGRVPDAFSARSTREKKKIKDKGNVGNKMESITHLSYYLFPSLCAALGSLYNLFFRITA